MADTREDFERRRFPWALGGFDLEGIVGAVAAWLVGILLGLIWGPLFWIGFLGAIAILLATRRARRTPPQTDGAIVAPVDGVIQSMDLVAPPAELRLGADEARRIRVASAPASVNNVHAMQAGEVETLIREPGEPSVAIAMEPDAHGLSVVYLTSLEDDYRVGMRLATGGFGPRLDIDVEAGDPLRVGRRIGKRRLGGWCDIYLPVELAPRVWVGMTLVAGETRLADPVAPGQGARPERDVTAAEESAPSQHASTESFGPDTDAAGSAGGAGETVARQDGDQAAREAGESDDPAEMFARLRSKVEEASKRDEDDG